MSLGTTRATSPLPPPTRGESSQLPTFSQTEQMSAEPTSRTRTDRQMSYQTRRNIDGTWKNKKDFKQEEETMKFLSTNLITRLEEKSPITNKPSEEHKKDCHAYDRDIRSWMVKKFLALVEERKIKSGEISEPSQVPKLGTVSEAVRGPPHTRESIITEGFRLVENSWLSKESEREERIEEEIGRIKEGEKIRIEEGDEDGDGEGEAARADDADEKVEEGEIKKRPKLLQRLTSLHWKGGGGKSKE